MQQVSPLKRNRYGRFNSNWKGGKPYTDHQGYIRIYIPLHYKASSNGYVHEHIVIAEKTLGKKLPEKAVVHHYAGYELDGKYKIVICEDKGYHNFLHKRMRALKKCGHPSWRRCRICGKWDKPENLYIRPDNKNGEQAFHRICKNAYARKRYHFKKGG